MSCVDSPIPPLLWNAARSRNFLQGMCLLGPWVYFVSVLRSGKCVRKVWSLGLSALRCGSVSLPGASMVAFSQQCRKSSRWWDLEAQAIFTFLTAADPLRAPSAPLDRCVRAKKPVCESHRHGGHTAPIGQYRFLPSRSHG